MAQITFLEKHGRKIVSRQFPYGWRKKVDALLKEYPIKSRIIITLQTSMSNFNKTFRKRAKTIQVGNHKWLEHKNASDIWAESKHVIHIWNYARMPLKTLLHELGHAHLQEKEYMNSFCWGRYNTEDNADAIVAHILFGGEMPLQYKSLSGMSLSEIRKWKKQVG